MFKFITPQEGDSITALLLNESLAEYKGITFKDGNFLYKQDDTFFLKWQKKMCKNIQGIDDDGMAVYKVVNTKNANDIVYTFINKTHFAFIFKTGNYWLEIKLPN